MKRSLIFSLVIALLSISSITSAQSSRRIKKQKPQSLLDSLIFKNLTNRVEVGFYNPSQYASGISSTYLNGLKVGLTSELKMKHNFSLLTGVLYTLAYSDKLQTYPSSYSKSVTTGHFLDIPLLGTYTLPISKNFKLFGYAGPNLNIGLMQKNTTLSTYVNTTYPVPSGYSNLYDSDLKRLDLQIHAGGGIQLYKYQIKAGYNFGLLNISNDSNLYQRGWQVSLGITF